MKAGPILLLLLVLTAVAPLGCTSKPAVEPAKTKTDDAPPKEKGLVDPANVKPR